MLQELTHDKEALQKQVYEQLNQISSLKSHVENLKLGVGASEGSDELPEVQNEREAMQAKQKEVR